MKLILAFDPDGGIGYKNKLPWDKIQGDLFRFKKLTTNGVVVMGRNTWESLPKKPLLDRLNFVVTSKDIELPYGAIAVPNLDHFKHYRGAWLIGGSKLIASSWDYITEVHLTRTYAKYTCDSYVDPLILEQNYKCESIQTHSDHTYEVWHKI